MPDRVASQAVTLVERGRRFVLDIGRQGMRGAFRAKGALQGIGQQGAFQALTSERPFDGLSIPSNAAHCRTKLDSLVPFQ